MRRTVAKVQRYDAVRLGELVSEERAVLPCGCSLYFGRSPRTRELTVVEQPCCRPHERITTRAGELAREALAAPPRKPYGEMCAEMLSRAATQAGLGSQANGNGNGHHS